MVPLAFVQASNGQDLVRFEADIQELAITAGKHEMAELTKANKTWAAARDGILRDGEVPVDVISVECWAPSMTEPIFINQRYKPFARERRLKLLGVVEIFISGKVAQPEVAAPALALVKQGLESHSQVAPLLHTWL